MMDFTKLKKLFPNTVFMPSDDPDVEDHMIYLND